MKFPFLILLAILALITTVAASDGCSIQDLCYNGDHQPFCAPTETSCTFASYTLVDGSCVATLEQDSDGDGWSDSCDAFPQNASEWMDLDADMVGYNTDCDDTNASIGACSIDPEDPVIEVNETTNVTTNATGNETTNQTESSTKTTSSSHRSHGINGDNVGQVSLVINKTSEQKPLAQNQTNQSAPAKEPLVVPSPVMITNQTNASQERSPGNLLTGNVVGNGSGTSSLWLWFILLFVLCLLLLLIILRRRKNK